MACKQCGGHTTNNNKFCSRSHATSYNNRTRLRVPAGEDSPKKIRRVRFPKECAVCRKLHKNKIFCSKECTLLSKRLVDLTPAVPDGLFDLPEFPLAGDAAS
jgi:hypothetical protein